METALLILDKIIPLLAAIGGVIGGMFIKSYGYKKEKEKSKNLLKAKLLDGILEQCRRMEKSLSNYPDFLKIYRNILNAEEIDPETKLPTNILNLDKKQAYEKYIKGIKAEKDRLRHIHQNYIIKIKLSEFHVLNVIDEGLTKIINYDDSPDFDYAAATMEFKEVYTNLRMIHLQIKEVYPVEVPLD